ncbi:MAG: SDR family oxidoreductase [Bacteroidia bacterium]|nr:SDR family oxidoreductase [Bacteroidia bacterium]
MDLGIQGKVAMVLASSKGLGRAIALELAKEGAKLIICGRNQESLSATAGEIQELGVEVLAVKTDLNTAEDRERLCKKAIDQFGCVDILVTNTGGPPPGVFEDFLNEDWKDYFNALFVSVTDIVAKVIPGMKDNQWGRILMVSSVSIKQPVPNLITSNAVRSSLLGLSKSLSNELAQYSITVNNLMPGYTLTTRLSNLIQQNPAVQEVTKEIPLGRFGKPEEFAAAAAFLVSDRASYISGVSLAVDGGWIRGI